MNEPWSAYFEAPDLSLISRLIWMADDAVDWAGGFEKRTWAVESAGGLGYLLSQQLVAAGETVLDVPATLSARVRLLGSGKSNKNDPKDALSVAVAALRAPRLASVERADHGAVLRLLAKRNIDLGRTRNLVACRLHALLAELVPGGMSGEMGAPMRLDFSSVRPRPERQFGDPEPAAAHTEIVPAGH